MIFTRRPTIALTHLEEELKRRRFDELYYRWCDSERHWSREATEVYPDDSLRGRTGSFHPLKLSEFMDAFRRTGARVSVDSRWERGYKRSFTVQISEGTVVCDLAIQLGRGLNMMEGNLLVQSGIGPPSLGEHLTVMARQIRMSRSRRELTPPYPRPNMGSRSQLEVVSRQMVELLRAVAHDW